MASTIENSTLKVTLTERIVLNGRDQGSTNELSITDINEVSKRIITVTTTESVIATFSSAVASAGHYVDTDVRYIRFTNKDDTNFIWNGDNVNGMGAVFNATQDADAASSANFGSLTNIQADADTASCDLEVFIASA